MQDQADRQDYQEHQNEIHAKLVAIMSDRLSVHVAALRVSQAYRGVKLTSRKSTGKQASKKLDLTHTPRC
jgi:hypothetical protein